MPCGDEAGVTREQLRTEREFLDRKVDRRFYCPHCDLGRLDDITANLRWPRYYRCSCCGASFVATLDRLPAKEG
jgi:transcription elongation factor Elf1